MTFTDLAKSYVRTVVPVLVGLVISLALRAGVDLHGYTPEISAAATAVYYALARGAEHYLSPRFGWLLGVAASPQYVRQANGRKRLPKDRGHVDPAAVLYFALVALVVVVILALLHVV